MSLTKKQILEHISKQPDDPWTEKKAQQALAQLRPFVESWVHHEQAILDAAERPWKEAMEAIERPWKKLAEDTERLWKELIEATKNVTRVWARVLQDDGTPRYHIVMLLGEVGSEEERQRSVDYLVKQIWKGRVSTSNPKARLGLKRLREKFVRMEDVLSLCVLVAIADSKIQQRIRIDKNSKVGHGRLFLTVPEKLPLELYQAWLWQQSRAYLEQKALEEDSEAQEYKDHKDPRRTRGRKRTSHGSSKHIYENDEEDRLIELLENSEESDFLSLLDTFKSWLSPTQQEYLEHKILAFEQGHPSITETDARVAVCKAMGITAVSARKIELRIRRKLACQ
jgi:hypothetical protein